MVSERRVSVEASVSEWEFMRKALYMHAKYRTTRHGEAAYALTLLDSVEAALAAVEEGTNEERAVRRDA